MISRTRRKFPLSWKGLILTPHPYAIGNRIEEIFFGLMLARRKGGKICLIEHLNSPLLHGYELSIRSALNLQSPCISHAPRLIHWLAALILSITYLPLRLASRALFRLSGKRLYESYNFPRIGVDNLWIDEPNETRDTFSWERAEAMNWQRQLEEYESPTLPLALSCACRDKLTNYGIGPDDWFVCWHVREPGFKKDFTRRSYRNADIANSILGIKEVTQRGGWVIRLGDDSMSPLPSMERVIDYPFTDLKSEEMDLFLVSNCRLYIGTISGPMELAILFGRQILLLNMYDWSCGNLIRDKDRGLLKHVYSVAEKRYLSLKELVEADRELLYTFGEKSSKYELVENSALEIKEAVIESLSIGNERTIEQSALQRHARERIKRSARKLISRDGFHPTGSKSEEVLRFQYKTAARVLLEKGAISQGYLDTNWERDELNHNTGSHSENTHPMV